MIDRFSLGVTALATRQGTMEEREHNQGWETPLANPAPWRGHAFSTFPPYGFCSDNWATQGYWNRS